MPGRAIRSAVRWRHASTTSRAWGGSSSANDRCGRWRSRSPRTGRVPGAAEEQVAPSVSGSANGRAARAGQAREAVLEDDDVVVGRGYLAGQPRRARDTAGTASARRLVGAVLAQRRDDHPLPGLAVEPQLGLLIPPRSGSGRRSGTGAGWCPGSEKNSSSRPSASVHRVGAVGVCSRHRRHVGDHQRRRRAPRSTARSAIGQTVVDDQGVHLRAAGRTRSRRPRRTSCGRPARPAAPPMPISVRFVCASAIFGVVSPASGSKPCTPR